MKKKIYAAIIVFLCMILLYLFTTPDYEMAGDICTLSDTGKEVELNVIVHKFWRTNELVEKIAREHARINGIPDSLVVNVYVSRFCLRRGYKFRTIQVTFTTAPSQKQLL
ncbi:hypothetical protein HGO97_010310 [Faecalicatena sp. AGMB00832]|uniref:Uncharacterized protein n=1 Tax=Faecalicatena faecalis TaxID=2726362 RepID=A0ABS6D4G0_9FIRM|nr:MULTISPECIES: hypothetical protein [Faecalicatena]MBU3876205.1 hypothetical protein [Faecalicatena faecalis]MCI6464144.1 hypothetical protein [Faecalicatena sp.]MDY5616993.1 hypothetical protein [Lachnospiraceae bacterium]